MKNWSMGHWWNDTDEGNPKIVLDKPVVDKTVLDKPVPLPICLPHSPRGLAFG